MLMIILTMPIGKNGTLNIKWFHLGSITAVSLRVEPFFIFIFAPKNTKLAFQNKTVDIILILLYTYIRNILDVHFRTERRPL